MHASHRALQRNRKNGENILTAYLDEHLKGEKRELVQALGRSRHNRLDIAFKVGEDFRGEVPALLVMNERKVFDMLDSDLNQDGEFLPRDLPMAEQDISSIRAGALLRQVLGLSGSKKAGSNRVTAGSK
ncbi:MULTISPECIES: hypothetical protein [unclassified Microbulbifer]|uniref:hypothetical protein n=1 Tax=unclassified Microbulbifer TaxID=2619833 RepID=UPI0027E3F6AE|nr:MULTISPECIES: hypothetical protein [unclassified Microbulbifer]